MPAPTVVASYGSGVWTSTASGISTSVTVAAGDTLVIYVASSDASVHTLSGGGLTYTFRAGIDNIGGVEIFSAPCPSTQTFTLTATKAASGGMHGFRVIRFANVASIGATGDAFDSVGEPQVNVTTTSDNSTLVYVSQDSALSSGAFVYDGPTGGSSFTALDPESESAYLVAGGYWYTSGTAGAKTVGMTNPPDQDWSAAVVEVVGTGTQPSGAATGSLLLSGTATASGVTSGAPSFVDSYGPASWADSTDTITASVTVAAGDTLVVYGGIHNGAVFHTSISGGGLTYTRQGGITGGTTSWCSTEMWTAPCPTSQTFTLSLTKATSTALHGFRALRFANVASIGNTTTANASNALPTASLTTQSATSAVVMLNTDWNGVAGARTYNQPAGSTAFSELSYYQAATWGVHGGYYPAVGAAGVKSIGMTTPTGQKYTLMGVELLGGATTNAVTASGSITLSGTATAQAASSGAVTKYDFNYSDGNVNRMTEALMIRPSDGRVHVIASAGRIWLSPTTLSTSSVNTFTSSTQLSVVGDVTGASWSPDGNSIAVITRSENIYIFNSAWVQQSLFTAPQAGGNTEAICWDAAGTALYFCYDNASGDGSALYRMVPGQAATLVGTLPAALSQCSGLTPSLTRPNVLYGILDYSSGGDIGVKVIDATNATLIESVPLTGATNFDWEDIEVSRFDGSIWVGDHGNYGGAAPLGRATHQLYRFEEAAAPPVVTTGSTHYVLIDGVWAAQQVSIL